MPVIRKLVRLGNSIVVGLPVAMQKHLDVMRGDYVVWHCEREGRVYMDKLTAGKEPGFFLPGSGIIKDDK